MIVKNPEATFNDDIYNQALCCIEDEVLMLGGKELREYDLPAPVRETEARVSREMFMEINYDTEKLAEEAENLQEGLTSDQRMIYESVLKVAENGIIAENDKTSNMIFLDAPGGTGKGYVINTVLKKIRSSGKIALATTTK